MRHRSHLGEWEEGLGRPKNATFCLFRNVGVLGRLGGWPFPAGWVFFRATPWGFMRNLGNVKNMGGGCQAGEIATHVAFPFMETAAS